MGQKESLSYVLKFQLLPAFFKDNKYYDTLAYFQIPIKYRQGDYHGVIFYDIQDLLYFKSLAGDDKDYNCDESINIENGTTGYVAFVTSSCVEEMTTKYLSEGCQETLSAAKAEATQYADTEKQNALDNSKKISEEQKQYFQHINKLISDYLTYVKETNSKMDKIIVSRDKLYPSSADSQHIIKFKITLLGTSTWYRMTDYGVQVDEGSAKTYGHANFQTLLEIAKLECLESKIVSALPDDYKLSGHAN